MNDIDLLKKQIEDLQNEADNLREKLQKQEKMASIGLLSAGIAHEVQNPLNFVINFSKLSENLVAELCEIIDANKDKLTQDEQDDIEDISADLKENLNKINEHGERAISIIRGILLQSRGKAGEFIPTDVAQLIHQYVWLGYHSMRANDKNFNVSIHEEYQENMPRMMVVPQDLSRAVLNLVNNAFYAINERTGLEPLDYKPSLNVKANLSEDNKLTIVISDNGIGMSDEVKTRLYENFFTTKPTGKGTGLGMGIVHEIITKLHNGLISVDSTVNVGTTFTIIIPVKIIK